MADNIKTEEVIKFFSTPYFDWYHRWEPILIQPIDHYNNKSGSPYPSSRTTYVLWKSKRTGDVKKKTYDYQI